MRQLLLAAGVVCAGGVLAHWASAQNQVSQTMPGQVVGTGINISPVGSAFPKAGAQVGQPINIPADSPLMRRADLTRPYDVFKGSGINPSSVVAPVPGIGDQSALSRFYDKVKASVGLATKDNNPPPPNVTPGIFRRNRERAQAQMWRRD
jgi:hypothetical protein